MNLEDLEQLWQRARKNPRRTLVLLLALALLAIAGTYTVAFVSEKGRQAAEPETHAILADPLSGETPSAEWREYAFHVTHDPDASLTLGRCPGTTCYHLRLGNLIREESTIFQELFMTGGGFGYRLKPRPGILAETRGMFRMSGGLSYVDFLPTGEVVAKIELAESNELSVCTEVLDLRLRVVDERADSLRLSLFVKEGSWVKEPPSARCPWFFEASSEAN